MKRIKSVLMMGMSGVLLVAMLAGCGGGNEEPPAEKPDREAPAFADQDATLTLTGAVNTENPEQAVSDDLFGLFLEDINYASQALDDNLIANGSFENTSKASGKTNDYAWSGASGLTFTVKNNAADRLHENSAYYADVTTSAGGTLTNDGFRPVPMYVQNGQEYVFSAFLRGYTGEITVKAKNTQGTFAEKTFSVSAPDDNTWYKTEQTIAATDTGRSGIKIEITFGSEGSFLIDAVQFETKDSTVGIKNYLYNAIKDLSPAFFRFPGGCIIEGKNFESAYDWKNSVGAVKRDGDDKMEGFTYTLNKDGQVSETTTYGEWATRTPNLNLWMQSGQYYPHEYGIGFYEYFLLCDSLGAKAIPIVNCGLSCQGQTGPKPGNAVALPGRHGKRVADYIQDAIDLIEFAKGSTDTEWGHIRELMGHPEPFRMDYIGIGNEQWGNYYKDYYEKFLKDPAFKKALSDYNVKPIVGNCTLFQNCENPALDRKGTAQDAAVDAAAKGIIDKISDYGVVDQHYYVNYTDFLMNTTLYDDYKRPSEAPDDYYEVFVGEYAVNSETVRAPSAYDNIHYRHTDNSMITALSEAAMMTGFERNGDIVKLAAYAPMFGSEKKTDRQWQVDMMYFSGENVLLTPNYYVQQLFMKNTGNYKVNAGVVYTSGSAPQTTYTASAGSGAEAERTADDIYYVASKDKATGDIILKIVNAGDKTMKFNVAFSVEGHTPAGIADVTRLVAESADTVNTMTDTPVAPETFTIGIEGSSFGYTVAPYSVTAIRIRTK